MENAWAPAGSGGGQIEIQMLLPDRSHCRNIHQCHREKSIGLESFQACGADATCPNAALGGKRRRLRRSKAAAGGWKQDDPLSGDELPPACCSGICFCPPTGISPSLGHISPLQHFHDSLPCSPCCRTPWATISGDFSIRAAALHGPPLLLKRFSPGPASGRGSCGSSGPALGGSPPASSSNNSRPAAPAPVRGC